MEFRRILVGVDGSTAAEAALRWAGEAVSPGGEVIAVHATGAALINQATVSAATGLGMFPGGRTRKEEARHALEARCEPLRRAGVPCRTLVCNEDPVQALLRTARREAADLIVIGHRGDTGLLHRFFQGLSDHVIDHARRPVVVVPGPPAARRGI